MRKPVIKYSMKEYEHHINFIVDSIQSIISELEGGDSGDDELMLVELLALVGDQLSDYQDKVMDEAYPESNRIRNSIERHARLLDYFRLKTYYLYLIKRKEKTIIYLVLLFLKRVWAKIVGQNQKDAKKKGKTHR